MTTFLVFVIGFSANALLYRFASDTGLATRDITCGALLFAGCIMFVVTALRKDKRPETICTALTTGGALFVVMIFGGTIAFWGLAEGVVRSGASRAGLFTAMIPVFTALFDSALGARFHRQLLINGSVLIVGGVFLAADGLRTAAHHTGDLILLVSVFSFAAANVAARTAMRRFTFYFVTACRCLGGGIGLLFCGGVPLAGGGWSLASGLLSACFMSAIYSLIRTHGPSKASLANIYASLLLSAFGFLLFSETIILIQGIGAVLILGATFREVMSNRPQKISHNISS